MTSCISLLIFAILFAFCIFYFVFLYFFHMIVEAILFPSKDGLELVPGGTNMSVVFQRPNGSIVYTKDCRLFKLDNDTVEVRIEEKLSHIVTLYRDPNGIYQVFML